MSNPLGDRSATIGWPDPKRTLLLQAALSPDERGLEALRGFSDAGGDILEPDDETATLLPLVSSNMVELGVDEPWLPLLKGVYRKAWYRNVATVRQAAGALDDLAAAGVPTLVLGGPALAQLHYRDMATRPFTSLDILVPLRAAQPARQALAKRGWRGMLGTGAALNGAYRGERFERAPNGDVGLRWYALAEPIDEEPFWEAAVRFELHDRTTLTLSPTDHLLHVCADGMRWGPAPPIQWAADAAMLIRSGPIDWDRLVTLATTGRLTLPLADALAYLDRALGIAVPAEALAALRAAPTRPPERYAYRAGLAAPLPHRTLALLWGRHRRLRRLGNDHPRYPSFAHYLAAVWRLSSPWRVPAQALRQLSPRSRAR